MKRTCNSTRNTHTHRQKLLEKRQEVLTGLGTRFDTAAAMDHLAEDDQASVSHDEFVSLRLNSLDYWQLREVDEALDRFAAGDYGICLGCDEPIPLNRLQAIPWARYCVQCQEARSQERETHPSFAAERRR